MTNDTQPVGTSASITELIVLGRDREAADAATRTSPPAPADGVAQLDEIIPLIAEVVNKIQPEQLDAPTPCANYTVSGVLNHMIDGATFFAPVFRGDAPGAAADATGPIQARWHRAMAELLSAMHSDGAQDRTIGTPLGEVPGSVFARYTAFDGLVHGWDLSVATGEAYAPTDAVVAEVDRAARELLQPEMRDGDAFAAETDAPADASPLERLVAFSGRSVNRTTEQV